MKPINLSVLCTFMIMGAITLGLYPDPGYSLDHDL